MKPIALLILLLPAVAHAEVAKATADVDGDGKADLIRVDDGGVEIALAGKKDSVWKPFAASGTVSDATITVGGPGKTPFIAVMATIGDAHEGVALRWGKGAVEELWRGEIGPVGRDGEYAVAIEAGPHGLVRYQTREDVVRCDGAAARLYPEAWDDAHGGFAAAHAEVAVAAGATVLAAGKTAPATAPITSVVYRAAAVSSDAAASDAGGLAAPTELADGDASTAWRAADGAGAFVTFRARKLGAKLGGLRIVPAGNRVARLAVVTKDHAYWVDVPDARGNDPYWVTIDPPVAAECVTVVLATFRGKGAAGLAELAVLGEDDLAPGGGDAALVSAVIAGGLDGDSAAKQLARRGAPAARAIENALASADGAARAALWTVLGQIADPGSAAALGDALASGTLDDDQAAIVAGGLGKLGDPGQDQLAKVVANADAGDAARMAAAGGLGDDRRDALVAALGAGSRELRKALAERLARAGSAWLIDAAKQAAADGTTDREADLWRALGLAAAADQDPGPAIDALAARAAEVSDYERRYRILAALAPLPDARAAAAVDTITAALGQDDDAAALRQIAASGLARAAVPEAAASLAKLAGDRDPGVRLAALGALAGRDDLGGQGGAAAAPSRDAVDRVLIDGLGDHWPEVRMTAAGALALACPRAGPTAALENAVDHDADLDVRGAALGSLVTCRAPAIADRLLAIAGNGEIALPLREHAVDLAAALGDPALAAPLAAHLDRWRNAAFSDEAALVLAQHAAAVIGLLGAGDAAAAKAALPSLLDTAQDPAFPEIQAAGAAGLGLLGPACTSEARRVLTGLARSEQAQVAQAAAHALSTCGQ